ncbi:MAG TPA: hypothetical protein VF105_10045 [Gemmatimonadaceae bacterium]
MTTISAAIPNVVATIRAAIALVEQVRRSPTGQMMRLIKAFIGLAAIIVVPVVLIYWARKKYRP